MLFEKANDFRCAKKCYVAVVSVLAFYSDEPSSNPTDVYSEKNEHKERLGMGHCKIRNDTRE